MVDALLAQSFELIKQMEMEVRLQDGIVRKQLSEKLTQYRITLKTQQQEFQSLRAQQNSVALLHGGNVASSHQGSISAENDRLIGVHDKIHRQNQVIANAQRSVFETEEVGVEIAEELARNREKVSKTYILYPCTKMMSARAH